MSILNYISHAHSEAY